MKTWLRWLLIITQVGGGFTGIVMITGNLQRAEYSTPPALVISFAFIALFGFIVVAGMLLVQDTARITPMRIALWLQVFLISSPIIAWKLSSGFCFNLTLIGDQFGFDFWLGSGFQFNLFTKLPWGIGINLFPILMLSLIRYLPIPQKTTAQHIPGQVSSIFQANILTTPPADQGTQLRTSAQGEAYPMIVSDPPTTEDEVPDEEAILPRQTLAGGDERRQ